MVLFPNSFFFNLQGLKKEKENCILGFKKVHKRLQATIVWKRRDDLKEAAVLLTLRLPVSGLAANQLAEVQSGCFVGVRGQSGLLLGGHMEVTVSGKTRWLARTVATQGTAAKNC